MLKPLHVLMVEDNPSDAQLMYHALRAAGFDPKGDRVETEPEFRASLLKSPEIILADYALPEFDAPEALRIMQESGLDVPFIVVSGSIGDERAVLLMQNGATDYIMKDRMARLGQAVTQALEQKELRTAKRLAECALSASEELMRNVFDYANTAMLLSDLDGRCVRANNAFVELFGYSQAEIKGLLNSDVVHPDDMAETQFRLKGLLAGEVRYFQIEKRYIHKDQRVIWGLANISLVRDARDKPLHVMVQVQDVTERVAAEAELRKSREKSDLLEVQFRQSHKMEAVGQLAAGVAHDFNNLLTIVVGYSQLVLENIPADDPNRESIEQIRKAGDRAAAVTRQLLAFGRKQILCPVVLDLNAQLSETEKMLRRLIGADVELTTILEPGLGRVTADPGQVEQVIMNLVINARDAMPQGGRLTIRTSNVSAAELRFPEATQLPPGPYAMLAVKDTGCGMSEAVRAHIFEPFFTTKEIGKGTGLGLATVFGIVRQSGGFMDVESEPGSGSTFRVFLPQVPEAVSGRTAGLEPVGGPRRGGETILLVEDEDAVRKLAKRILESNGYNVLSTRHGGAAMHVCHEYAEEIHLLFTDVVMPGMSGRQLADLLVPLRPGIKLLYMSGYTDDTMVRHGIQDEGTNFLSKPFTPLTLAQKVRDVLDGPQVRSDPSNSRLRARSNPAV